MSAPCDSFRDEFLGAAPSERPSAHRASCAACGRWARGVELRERALGDLARLTAPRELEGAVVAALEAGFRQDRAVGALCGLGRITSPPELEDALSDRIARRETSSDVEFGGAPPSLPAARRLSAPALLAELVSEELRDPAAHRVRRFVGSLERFAAPDELAERLAAQDWSRPQRRLARPVAVLTLLAAVVSVAFLTLRGPEPRRYDFVVEVVDDPAQLSGMAASLLDGVSGGVLSVGRL